MIRREENDRLLLIRQDDHARLSSELARRIGHGPFESLLAREPGMGEKALVAIAHHDDGWPAHDNSPTLNPRLQPRDVFESKPEASIKIWTESADRAQEIDPYVGLLVSLHGLGLSVFVLNELVHHFSRKQVAYTRDRFDLNRFQHNEIERQQGLRTIIGLQNDLPLHYGVTKLGENPQEDLLIHHFRTLQAMDRLSLALCCTRSPFDTFEIAHHVGQKLSRVRVKRVGDRGLVVDPWVFDQARLTVTVICRALPKQTFADEATFRAIYDAAPTEAIEFVLEPGV